VTMRGRAGLARLGSIEIEDVWASPGVPERGNHVRSI
jgi:hypothetical protein